MYTTQPECTTPDVRSAREPRSAISGVWHNDNPVREGTRLGLLVAINTWIWIALVDMIVGDPFRTFSVLGGIIFFTAMHFGLNVTYGVAIVSVIHGAVRTPSLIIALVFGFLVIEIAFAMVTVVLSHLGLGDLAWLRIFGGSLIGAAVAVKILTRRYPLAALLREAEAER